MVVTFRKVLSDYPTTGTELEDFSADFYIMSIFHPASLTVPTTYSSTTELIDLLNPRVFQTNFSVGWELDPSKLVY